MSLTATMKGRWTLLFYTALSALIGMSWLTTRLGGSLWGMLNVGLVGQIGAAAVAGYAMIKAVPEKWPAAFVLIGAGPMAIQMVRLVSYIGFIVRVYDIPAVLLIGGSLGTIAVALWIVVKPHPGPLPEPPVAPARVVDTDE